MNFKMRTLILLILFTFLPPQSFAQKNPVACANEIRAVFDLGSGSTKMQVAEVNSCSGQIHRRLRKESAKINIKESLAKNSDQSVDSQTQSQLIRKLSDMVREAKRLGAKHFSAVATAAYRDAKNSSEILSAIEKRTSLKVKVIPQKEEADLGFKAARSTLKLKPEETLYVWDIGGGSQQFSSDRGPLFLGDLGSVGFKNLFIEKIQKSNSKEKKSPNPITSEDALAGIELAESYAKNKIPSPLLQTFQKTSQKPVGLGGVLAISLPKQLKSSGAYSKEDLLRLLNLRANWTDQQIGGAYAATDITNVILVLGFMKALNINSVQPLELDLTEALLIQKANY